MFKGVWSFQLDCFLLKIGVIGQITKNRKGCFLLLCDRYDSGMSSAIKLGESKTELLNQWMKNGVVKHACTQTAHTQRHNLLRSVLSIICSMQCCPLVKVVGSLSTAGASSEGPANPSQTVGELPDFLCTCRGAHLTGYTLYRTHNWNHSILTALKGC